MKIDEDLALKVNGVFHAMWGVNNMLVKGPAKPFGKMLCKPNTIDSVFGSAGHTAAGFGVVVAGTREILLAGDKDIPKQSKKKMLKASAAYMAGWCGVLAYHIQKKNVNPVVGWADVGACAGVGALSAWQGFKKD